MRNLYSVCLPLSCLLVGNLALSAYGQKTSMVIVQRPRPVSATEIKLSEFALPPYTPELISLSANPGGGLRLQTLMPIAGRMAATTDEAKLKGAVAPPAGVYVYTTTIDGQGQITVAPGAVFGQPDARVKVAEGTPLDWAVWGTNSNDGPLRLPYGGGLTTVPAPIQPSRQVRQLRLAVDGSGLNYANYSLYPQYRLLTRALDPARYQMVSRLEEATPQQTVNQAKMPRYIPVEGDTPWERGQVITFSSTGSNQRFEGIATRFVEGDKNASARQANILTFDEAGNLIKDQPLTFTYNRKLSMRLPVHDAMGKTVGSFNVFSDGSGKKDARDPQENRFSVVVTDEQGGIWSQFEWTNGEGSNRAIIPTYVLRKGDNLLVYNTNQQKILKSVEESWLIDKTGKATLVNSLPNGEVIGRSTEVIDSPTNVISGSQRLGWSNYSGAHYLDSFVDAQGEAWLLLQRQDDAPGGSASTPSPSATSPTGRLMGFASKLNQMAGQAPAPAAPTAGSTESGKIYSDVFVLHLDKDLQLKDQTVVRLDPMPQPLRYQRSVRSSGSDYVLATPATTRLRIRSGEALGVQRLTPTESLRMGSPASEVDNFLLDEAGGKIYVLSGIPRKPGLGQLSIYSLD